MANIKDKPEGLCIPALQDSHHFRLTGVTLFF